jgi:hypothetical protein
VWASFLAALITAALLAAPSALADPTPDQAIAELNAWRGQLGEGLVSTTSVPAWNMGCQHHNNYEQQNNTLTHFETFGNPGYTDDGHVAGPDSVLAEEFSSPGPLPDNQLVPGPVWDSAVFHRVALLQPRLANGVQLDDVQQRHVLLLAMHVGPERPVGHPHVHAANGDRQHKHDPAAHPLSVSGERRDRRSDHVPSRHRVT